MIVATVAISLLLLCVNRGTLAAVALGKAYEHPSNFFRQFDLATELLFGRAILVLEFKAIISLV